MRSRLLHAYASFALRRPLVLVAIAVALSAIAASLIPRLQVVTARSRQASPEHPLMARLLRFVGEFGGIETLVVLASSESPERARAFLDRLSPALLAEKDEVRGAFHKLDLGALREKALLYAPLAVLEGIDVALSRPELAPKKLAEVRSLADAIDVLERQAAAGLEGETAHSQASPAPAQVAPTLRALRRLFDELATWVSDPSRKSIDLFAELARTHAGTARRGLDDRGYLVGKDGRTFLLFVYPRKDEDSAENLTAFTKRVNEVIARERSRFAASAGPALEVGLTGMPASIKDEMQTIQDDMTRVSLGAFFGVGLLLLLSYGFSIRIVLAMAPIIVGTLWTFGFAAAAVGHLSLLSSVFSAVLFGLGDDFGIHLLARFEEEWARSGDARAAAETAIVETGPGVMTGALTTAIAFYTTLFVEMDAFGELGLIAGTGLLLVALAAFLLLPPLFLVWARLRARAARRGRVLQTAQPGQLFARVVSGRLIKYPKVVVAVAALAVAFFLTRAGSVPFDYDYVKLLPPGAPSTKFYQKLLETGDFASDFSAGTSDTLEELDAKVRALAKLPTVARVESVMPLVELVRSIANVGEATPRASPGEPSAGREAALAPLLPADQDQKLARLRTLRPKLDALPVLRGAPGLDAARRIAPALARLGERLERVLEAAPASLAKVVAELLKAVYGALRAVRSSDGAVARAHAFDAELFARISEAIDFLKSGARGQDPVTTHDLLASGRGILERLVGKSGKYAFYAFPAGPVWERPFLSKFVAETATVDPQMTGFPVGFHHFSDRIQEGFRLAALYAALAILAFLLLEFRGIVNTLLASLPLFVGAATMFGLMDLFGIAYNPANVIALPLVLGMGVEYGVETVHRFAESRGLDVRGVLTTTARAITVAGLTTLMGLGTMGLASHPGLASLGVILLFGIGGCLAASVLVLPSILILLAAFRRRKGGAADDPR